MSSKVLLIDADSTIPNLALMKISRYHKSLGNNVDLLKLGISYYPNRRNNTHIIDGKGYDMIFCSVLFERSINYIKGDNIVFGGTGYSLSKTLSEHIECLDPDYSIYPENKISYGFISRGCIRTCDFCKVPEKEGKIRQVNTIDAIVRHKRVKFLDNNFLALSNHKELLQELINKNIKCQFNQGLDIRLLDIENSSLLSLVNVIDGHIFAFDDWSYLSTVENKLQLLEWRKEWELMFFVYCSSKTHPSNVIKRINYLREHKLLVYLMRDINCWSSPYDKLYKDLAAWCNQHGLFKHMDFKEFLVKRYSYSKSSERVKSSLGFYLRYSNLAY